MTKGTQKKLQEQLANPSFREYLYNCLDVESATAYFKKHDLELTEDEILKLLNGIKADKAKFGDLSDDELDTVVGGNDKPCLKWDCYGLCLEWQR